MSDYHKSTSDEANEGHSHGDGWFERPETVRWILRSLYATCLVLFLADALYKKKVYFDFENWFGFYALYGFIACVVLVLISKQLRKVLARSESYYDERSDGNDDG